MGFLLRQMRLTVRSVRAFNVFINNPGPDYGAFGVETDTGSTWIDGRTIFRKVLDMGELPDGEAVPAAQASVNHNIPGLLQVVRMWAISVSATPTWRKVPYNNAHVITTNPPLERAVDALVLEANTIVLAITTYADWTGITAFGVMEYTRS